MTIDPIRVWGRLSYNGLSTGLIKGALDINCYIAYVAIQVFTAL